MADILLARVQQKKATEAEWLANPLILLDGEQAFVVNEAEEPVNFKIGDGTKTFAELPYWINYAANIVLPTVPPGSTLPDAGESGKLMVLNAGTYTQPGSSDTITAAANSFTVAFWDGTVWSIIVSIVLTSTSVTIPAWAAINYASGVQVLRNGKLYQSNTSTTGTDEPGVSSKWDNVLTGYADAAQVALMATLLSKISNLLTKEFNIVDPSGKSIFRAAKGVVEYIGQVKQSDLQAIWTAINSNPILSSITNYYPQGVYVNDKNGKAIVVAERGNVDFIGKNKGVIQPQFASPKFGGDYIMISVYSQSNGVMGTASFPTDLPKTFTFTGGVLTDYDPDVTGAADTYFGSDLIPVPTTGADILKGTIAVIRDMIKNENGVDYANQPNFIINSAGTPGQKYSVLSDPTSKEYRRFMESIQRAKNFAIARGGTFKFLGVLYLQGEASADRDKSQAQWKSDLTSLFSMINTDAKAIAQQTEDVCFLTYQIASHMELGTGVPLAELEISNTQANVVYGTSMYQYIYANDGLRVHLTNDYYRIMYGGDGPALKRYLIDGIKVKAVQPLEWSVQQNQSGDKWIINMKMNVPVKPLVFDSSISGVFITPPVNNGFSIKNGSTEIITSVGISNRDSLRIICNQNPAGKTLTYAIGGNDSGGYLRDSQGDTVKVQAGGVLRRVDNWCAIFSITI